jgi:hypothetical protein
MAKLMERLGHHQYFVHGQHAGSMVGRYMSLIYPNRVLGLHTSSILTSLYQQTFNASSPGVIQETGSIHMMATKPDTLGAGLSDSPAGLAAHLLEKFSTWTKRGNINKPDGGLFDTYSLDNLLTNVMIYWVSNTATTSCRLFKEILDFELENNIAEQSPVSPVIFGYARFPEGGLVNSPKETLKQVFPNLIHYTYMSRGGLLPSFENPALLSADVRFFVEKAAVVLNQNPHLHQKEDHPQEGHHIQIQPQSHPHSIEHETRDQHHDEHQQDEHQHEHQPIQQKPHFETRHHHEHHEHHHHQQHQQHHHHENKVIILNGPETETHHQHLPHDHEPQHVPRESRDPHHVTQNVPHQIVKVITLHKGIPKPLVQTQYQSHLQNKLLAHLIQAQIQAKSKSPQNGVHHKIQHLSH